MVLGNKSGRQSLQIKLESWGMTATDDQFREMFDLVKDKAIGKKSYLSDEEFGVIASQALKQSLSV